MSKIPSEDPKLGVPPRSLLKSIVVQIGKSLFNKNRFYSNRFVIPFSPWLYSLKLWGVLFLWDSDA